MRRSHHALKSPALSVCPNCNEVKYPHSVCESCGHYKGKQVLEPKRAQLPIEGEEFNTEA